MGTSRGSSKSTEHTLGAKWLKETSHKVPNNIKKAGTKFVKFCQNVYKLHQQQRHF
jgi:hypothetical protein